MTATKTSRNAARKKNGKEDEDDAPEYEAENINGYFEIDEILDRRVCKYSTFGSQKDGFRQVVEYCKRCCCCCMIHGKCC